MVWIKRIEIMLYIIVFLAISICTYDSYNRFYIADFLVKIFCGNTLGDCHFKVEEIYGLFHYFGSVLFLIFGQKELFFILGQVITLAVYCLLIRVCFYICYKLIFLLNNR